MPTIADVERQALKLKPSQQLRLVEKLAQRLPDPASRSITPEVLEKRVREFTSGKAKGVPIHRMHEEMRKLARL